MTEAELPGSGLHVITWERTIAGNWRVTCRCGWEMEAPSKGYVLGRASTHEMDMNNEPMSDCDGCGKPTVQLDLREVKGYGERLFCPTCREVPTDREIEKARRLKAALFGWKYEP